MGQPLKLLLDRKFGLQRNPIVGLAHRLACLHNRAGRIGLEAWAYAIM